MSNLTKIFIISGIIFITAGIGLFILQKLNIPLGRLPGDIAIKNERFSFYFPLTTCIIISILLSLIVYFFRR